MSRRLEDLHPELAALARRLLDQAAAAGLPLVVTQTLRTLAEQAALYAQGRTKPGPRVTNAKPGSTPHNYGLAFDVAFKRGEKDVTWDEPRPGAWAEVGALGQALGLVWGGSFRSLKDSPHFEMPGWKWVAAKAREEAAA